MQLNISGGMRFQTKQEFVYHTLRDAIIRCEVKPGTRLVIEDIAQRLSVSPIPVREALQLLQSERLVESVPHIGATVAHISESSVSEVFTIMEGLEVISTRVATQKMTKEEIETILVTIIFSAYAFFSAKIRMVEVKSGVKLHHCIKLQTEMRLS